MGLETGTYIDSLVATNPVGATDQKSQGDDHLRLIKSTILNTFPSIVGAVNLTDTQLNNAAIKTDASNTFLALLADSYDGILAANLVDKTAIETITAAWAFDAVTAVSYEGILATNILGEITPIDTTVVNSDSAQPGYKGAPQRAVASSDSLVLTDVGKQIYLNAGSGQTLTIPANGGVAFEIGTIILVINDSGNDWSIAITTDTLEKYGAATGTQTLGDNEKAVVEKVTATLWKYSSTD